MKPYFEISTKKVLEQYNKIKSISDIVSYSSKTNPTITSILENNTDCLISIHFENELVHVKDKSRVLFIGQGWDNDRIDNLIKLGVNKFIVDNIEDLNILIDYIEKNNVNIELLLRVKLKEMTLRTEKYFVFGMETEVVKKQIETLSQHHNVTKLGIHFHRKTQNMAEWELEHELKDMFNETIFKKIDYVNIGGGLPSIYSNTNIKIFDSIYKKILELKQWLNEQNVQLISEPGRYIAGPSGKLVTKIISVHDNNIIVNASVYNTNVDALITSLRLLVEGEKEKGKAYVIKGLTPCSMDLFRYRVYLDNVNVGNKLVFLNAGAYNFSSDFCNLEKIETKVIE